MRFGALDSWRGVAAISVMLFHLSINGVFYGFPPIRHAGLSVSFFFVLSGFVITHAYGDRLNDLADLRRFVIRRFGRLYPLHLATLLILVGLEVVKLILTSKGINSGQKPFAGSNDIASLIANLFLLQAVIPFPDYSWNGPSWTISVEFYTYLIFAAEMLLFRRFTVAVSLVLVASSAAALFYAAEYLPHLHETQGVGFLACICGFFTGHVVYRLYRRLPAPSPGNATLYEGFCTAMVLAIYWFDPFMLPVTIFLLAIVVLVFAFGAGAVSTVLRRPLLLRLGDLSYSIYLLHYVLIAILGGAVRAAQSVFHVKLYHEVAGAQLIDFGPAGAMDMLALVFTVTVILLAVVSNRLIEKPGQRFFNGLTTRIPGPAIGRPEPSAP